LFVFAGVLFLASTQFTLFVVQPIGAVPEGQTILMTRLKTLKFVDSADAWCERQMGRVNLICRAVVMAKVAKEARVLVRLPHSSFLYEWSTGGKTYSR
jgi:hypothetical protein